MRLRRLGTRYWKAGALTLCYLPFVLLTSSAQKGKESASVPSGPEREQTAAATPKKPDPALQASFETYTPKERSWWAYQKPTRPQLPAVKNPDWVKTPVDAFVLARLQKEGLTPAAPADRA